METQDILVYKEKFPRVKGYASAYGLPLLYEGLMVYTFLDILRGIVYRICLRKTFDKAEVFSNASLEKTVPQRVLECVDFLEEQAEQVNWLELYVTTSITHREILREIGI